MSDDLFTKGNITTFATWGAIAISALLSYIGIEVDQALLIGPLAWLCTLIIAIYSSKHPNQLEILGNSQNEIDQEKAELKEIKDLTIEDLIDRYQANDTIEVESDDTDLDDS